MHSLFPKTTLVLVGVAVLSLAAGCARHRPPTPPTAAPTQPVPMQPEGDEQMPTAIAPREFLRIPPPDAGSARVPAGYRVEIAVQDLIYPSSVEFDDAGDMYIAEAGYIYGDLVAPARILRVRQDRIEIVADQLNGPITDLLWHDGALYISHRGKISVLDKAGTRHVRARRHSLRGRRRVRPARLAPDRQRRRRDLGDPPGRVVRLPRLRRRSARYPVDVKFSRDGNALYIVDIGALTGFPAGGGPAARPFPGSGVVWRVVKEGSASTGPTNLSPIPRAATGK